MLRALVGLWAVTLVACSPAQEDFGGQPPRSNRTVELPVQERAKILPNQLFEAVWNGSVEEVAQLAEKNPSLLQSRNSNGDTALGLALREGRKTVAENLLFATSAQDLTTVNNNGESYIFLAAQAGYADLITAMAEAYYKTLGALDDYEFADLDQQTTQGQRALFVASNRLVAEALEAQYYRGRWELPFWEFMMKEDVASRVFLHSAAEQGRDEVILWAVDRMCTPGAWEKSESVWLRWPATALSYGLRGAQTHVLGDWGLPTDLLFNRRDQDGQTAMHVAIRHRRWAAVRALAHCRWLDYQLADTQGSYPLQAFLKTLNPYLNPVDQETRDTFEFLTSQTSHLRLSGVAAIVNHVDLDGNSALHLAARLADSYFYKRLEKLGDVYLSNAQGESARNIFLRRHGQAAK